jgi:hypothetical protein
VGGCLQSPLTLSASQFHDLAPEMWQKKRAIVARRLASVIAYYRCHGTCARDPTDLLLTGADPQSQKIRRSVRHPSPGYPVPRRRPTTANPSRQVPISRRTPEHGQWGPNFRRRLSSQN